LLSLGVGGLWGARIGEGSHKFGFVPEQQTDFILSLIGEELGFLGTSFVVLMYAVIFACGMRIAWRLADPLARLLVTGLTTLITLQALINIGVVSCSLPNKGIPLPFVSYGGSDVVCLSMAVGLIVAVVRRAAVVPAAERATVVEDERVRERRARLASVALGRAHLPWWRRWLRLERWGRRAAQSPVAALRSYQRPRGTAAAGTSTR
jgi:hypothetical protein